MILIADNLNAMNPVVAEALGRLDPGPIQALARRCEEAGAAWLALNPGFLSPRREDRMAFMVEAVEQAASARILLDSPHPRILAAGLAVCRGRAAVNALTLDREKVLEIPRLAAAHGADLVVLLAGERGYTPVRMEEKIALALELREHALREGLGDEDLIFDPVLPSLRAEDARVQIAEGVKTVRALSSGAILGAPARTMAGLSNLRSGFRKRIPPSVDQTCLALLAGAGMEFILADALDPQVLDTLRLVNALQGG